MDQVPRKYQVFISSTFKDLKRERARAMYSVVSAGHMATNLETWGLENEPQIDVIKSAVEGSQFYVLILGHCYGSIPAEREKSYTELELDFAERHFGKLHSNRILSFILDQDLVDKRRRGLNRQTIDGQRELENEKKLNAFRARLMTAGRWWRPFRSSRDIERDLFAFFREKHSDVPGYVLETEDTELIIRISASNQVVREVVQRAGRFTVVEDRLAQAPGKKVALAQAFCALHGQDIRTGKFDKVFIESGSTLTYLASELAPYLPKGGDAHPILGSEISKSDRKPRVATNNALAYLDLWLCNGVNCRAEPDSPPTADEKYGAMYGPVTGKKREPDYSLPALQSDDKHSWELVDNLRKEVFLEGVGEPGSSLVLAAASGLQLNDEVVAIEPRSPGPRQPADQDVPYTFEPILALVRKCRGFHVGSYENKLLKRSLYLTNVPTIVFIHDEKINCPVQIGKCHFLFDVDYTWQQVVETYPLSIWVGCGQTSYQDVMAALKCSLPANWVFRPYGNGDHPVVVGHNASFRESCRLTGVSVFE
jgi:hypothetical protein